MLIKILGWFWLITGIIFLLFPGMLKKRLQKKSIKRVRKFLFLIVISLSFLLIGAAWKSQGALSKLVMVLGILGLFKGFFLLKAKAADKIIEWFINKPIVFFRIWAAAQVLIGFIILKLHS